MKRPEIKDKNALLYVEYLENRLKQYESSPYYNSFVSLKAQLDNWNNQLKTNPIDLFAESTDKSFDRTKWFFENVFDLNENLSKLSKLMIPEDVKRAEEEAKVASLGIAEQLALKNLDKDKK